MIDADRHPLIQKGLILFEQGRYHDAARTFKDFLSAEPNNAWALHLLASCQYHDPKSKKLALSTIDAAIRLEPQSGWHYELKALILSGLEQHRAALKLMSAALQLEPESAHTHATQAYIYMNMNQWAKAEACARRALSLDADNLFAGNLLATSLRLQNRLTENEHLVADLLRRDPQDAVSHSNAGWVHFQKGDYKQAMVHFKESLRLDPMFEPARIGMLETFKAKSFLYRSHIRYSLFMSRQSKLTQWVIIIGIIFAFRLIRITLSASFEGRFAFLAVWLIVPYFLFIFWTWLAPGFGNWIVWCDPVAHYALKKNEKADAIFVGGFLIVGLAAIVLGLLSSVKTFYLFGAALLLTTIPFSCTFLNDRRAGKIFYGAIGTTIGVLGFFSLGVYLASGSLNQPFIQMSWLVMMILFVACTWLGAFNFLRK